MHCNHDSTQKFASASNLVLKRVTHNCRSIESECHLLLNSACASSVAGSITLVMYLSLYFLDVDQGLSSRTQWVLGFILLALIAGTCLWFLFNIFRRKEVLVALLKSTTVTASRGLAQIRTMVKSDRLRSMITRSTDRSTSNVTLTSNATMTTNAEE